MEEQQNVPWRDPVTNKPLEVLPTGRQELVLASLSILFSVLQVNFLLWGDMNLGFALATIAVTATNMIYLLRSGAKPTFYSAALLCLSMVIVAGCAWTDQSELKMKICMFLSIVTNLGLCLLAGKNTRDPGSVASLIDAPLTFFTLGFGKMDAAGRGLRAGFRAGGSASRKFGSLMVGLLIAIPLMGVLVALLTSADAAFEALLSKLPKFNWFEWIISLIFGGFLGMILYSRTVALCHGALKKPEKHPWKGVPALTLNTTLIAVCLVYVVYLLSQMAYFVGGFAGLLPENYTVAEYARRGFFEIAWICGINLGILALSMGLLPREQKLPAVTRIAGVFLGLVTVFLICTEAAKMSMYIGSFGLTPLRVLTMVFLLWLGITMTLVCVRLFVKFPYMKTVVTVALILAAGVIWVDVDARVAQYNVTVYQSGTLDTVDVDYLGQLSAGAVPYLEALTHDSDPAVAEDAKEVLRTYGDQDDLFEGGALVGDIREWNYAAAKADEILEPYRTQEAADNNK